MSRVLTLPATRVVHGLDAADEVGAELARLDARRPLIVASDTLARATDVVDRVAAAAGGEPAGVVHDIPQHVPRDAVLAAAERYRATDADSLVSVGGGTQIDAAKAVALSIADGLADADSLASYRVRRDDAGNRVAPQPTGTPPPHVAVSTTLSGAEFTGIVGITDPDRGVKEIVLSLALQPPTAVLDPGLTAHTPAWLWVASGVRAVDHVVEGVCSPRHSLVADVTLLGALRILATDLLPSAGEPEDVAARERCQLAAWMAIMHLPNVAMGLSHAIGHQLGARFDVPHGVTSCVTLPAVMAFNLSVAADRLALLAAPLGVDGADEDTRARAAIEAVRALIVAAPVPARLRDVGVGDDDLVWLAEEALADLSADGSPRPASVDDVVGVLRDAW